MTNVSLHRFSRLPRQFLTALGLGVGLLVIGAIAPPPSPTQDTATDGPELMTPGYDALSSAVNAPETLWDASDANAPNTQPVLFYTPAESCEVFQTEERAIAADKAIPQIVHFLLAEQTDHLLEFELAGYRIQPGGKGNVVTIDFRRAPDAQRHFVSLSMCEQMALFGSLRKTLVENPALNVDSVRFTERGRLIEI